MNVKIIFVILFLLGSFVIQAQTLQLNIVGLRNNEGSIVLSFYQTPESFDEGLPDFRKIVSKSGMKNDSLTIKLEDLAPGRYGVVMIDDENENGKLDSRLFIPKEGFGFTDFPFRDMRKPDYKSFSFYLPIEGAEHEIEVYYFSLGF